MLHFDILRLISLQLDPYELSISKELHIMYNDAWYYDKLVLLYPDLNLFTTTDYKDLYKKSLMQGNISYYTSISYVLINIKGIKGIKASQIDGGDNLILTFNGDLWCDDTILDKNVIDISYNAYIKTKELYLFEDGEWTIKITDNKKISTIKIADNKKLFRIEYYYTGIYAIDSEDGIFIYRDNSLRYIQFEDKVDFVLNYYLYISDVYNNVFYLDVYEKMFDLTQRHDIKLKDGIMYNNSGNLIRTVSVDIRLFKEKFAIIPFKHPCKKMCSFDQYVIILSDGKGYFYKYSDKQYISTDITLENIKNIFANNEGKFYIIK
jgi:hypothetical protein